MNGKYEIKYCASTTKHEMYPVNKLPSKYRHLFSNYTHFNRIQTNSIETILDTDESVVVSAPTGSGKTAVYELSIVRLLETSNRKNEEMKDIKIIYVAPTKALCSERFRDWQDKFAIHGLSCIEITGDNESYDEVSTKNRYQIILTTPEKWDSMTRSFKFRNYISQLNVIKLLIIDEVHILNEYVRGVTLESIVCRMKLSRNTKKNLRFVAGSATIPNIEDIAKWLCVDSEYPAHYFKVSEEERPVKLQKVVIGYTNSSNSFCFDIHLSYKIEPLIKKYSNGRPTLIFCTSRKGAENTCNVLIKKLDVSLTDEKKINIEDCIQKLDNAKLKELLKFGIGFHHAGMSLNDRNCLEGLFKEGFLPILVATSTLSQGVNLPAHLVIIKSTEHYTNHGPKEYEESLILQMIGRAGRPQYDKVATAIIMTRSTKKEKYDKLVNGTQVVESHLHERLEEYLNVEISFGTINDISVAKGWMRSTFLYIRACRSPQSYSMASNLKIQEVENQLHDLCLTALKKLSNYGLIHFCDGLNIGLKQEGEIMAKYMISCETMKSFMSLKGNEDLCDLIKILINTKEFESIKLRNADKETLNMLNKNKNHDANRIRFPIEGSIKSRENKINCLLQATLGTLNLTNISLIQDVNQIFLISIRLAKAIKEIECRHTSFISARAACILVKCLVAKLWENSNYVAMQMHGIGPIYSEYLVQNEITSVQSILSADPRSIERILGRKPPFGNRIQEFFRQIPRYKIRLSYNKSSICVNLEITLINSEDVDKKSRHAVTVLVGDSKNCLLKILYLRNEDFLNGYKTIRTSISLNISNICMGNLNYSIAACVISEKWVGNDIEVILPIMNTSEHTKETISGENVFIAVLPSSDITEKSNKRKNSKENIINERIIPLSSENDNSQLVNEEIDNQNTKNGLDEQKIKYSLVNFNVALKDNEEKSAKWKVENNNKDNVRNEQSFFTLKKALTHKIYSSDTGGLVQDNNLDEFFKDDPLDYLFLGVDDQSNASNEKMYSDKIQHFSNENNIKRATFDPVINCRRNNTQENIVNYETKYSTLENFSQELNESLDTDSNRYITPSNKLNLNPFSFTKSTDKTEIEQNPQISNTLCKLSIDLNKPEKINNGSTNIFCNTEKPKPEFNDDSLNKHISVPHELQVEYDVYHKEQNDVLKMQPVTPLETKIPKELYLKNVIYNLMNKKVGETRLSKDNFFLQPLRMSNSLRNELYKRKISDIVSTTFSQLNCKKRKETDKFSQPLPTTSTRSLSQRINANLEAVEFYGCSLKHSPSTSKYDERKTAPLTVPYSLLTRVTENSSQSCVRSRSRPFKRLGTGLKLNVKSPNVSFSTPACRIISDCQNVNLKRLNKSDLHQTMFDDHSVGTTETSEHKTIFENSTTTLSNQLAFPSDVDKKSVVPLATDNTKKSTLDKYFKRTKCIKKLTDLKLNDDSG
ncbi:probable ATP-dependent DNA helicase HFM1 [Adelges cooleyi]|uniref:probable ATP-dependent DNA helicase HFM1 n=1 Tax=Adelges cooleyi TaxID=133065 RepID=UPI00217F23D1|nr:probable ATP-dependent DNA helicase HFM1 [Adelges cooleyi]